MSSHDEMNERGTATRKERRKAYGKRNPVVRRPFTAADHIRNDWTPDEVALFCEGSAHGYNGRLREYLCTAAHQLRAAGAEIDRLEEQNAEYKAAYEAGEEEIKGIFEDAAGEDI